MHATTSNPSPSAAAMPPGASTAKALEFLAFTLGQEEYGIDIQKVQELRVPDPFAFPLNDPRMSGLVFPIDPAFSESTLIY